MGSGPSRWWPCFCSRPGKSSYLPSKAIATRTGKSSTRKPRRQARRNTAADAAPQLPGISSAERRKLAQEEARWRAESDLRTLRQAEEIRRDSARLKQAATMTAEEMKALQAVRAIKQGR